MARKASGAKSSGRVGAGLSGDCKQPGGHREDENGAEQSGGRWAARMVSIKQQQAKGPLEGAAQPGERVFKKVSGNREGVEQSGGRLMAKTAPSGKEGAEQPEGRRMVWRAPEQPGRSCS